ncbi:RNA-directed DNA polymerase [Schaalia georgiae]|nr:RNA-directed DNA polymerase [Schaalia georgiae]
MAFIIPVGCYCYICMFFGLKNAGFIFQRVLRECLGFQLGRNAEVYMDDIVIKSKRGGSLIDDLRETFDNFRRIKFKLNFDKCIFGVNFG